MLKSKKNIAIIIAFVAFLFLLDFIFNHLSYSFTNSVGYNLFYVTKRFQEIKKGDYVMFVMPSANIKILKEEIKKFKTNIAVKQVACMPGDRITVKNRMFYCNGYYLGTAKTKAKPASLSLISTSMAPYRTDTFSLLALIQTLTTAGILA